MAKDMMCKCCPHKGHGVKMLILGLIVLANVYWAFMNWWTLIGVLLVLGGLLKLMMK
jgi:uncharacterized membrane protein HdeD (DUF308 family)